VARFLFTVWPFAGHVHPAVAIAHALRARGHEIAFYTGTAVRPTVEGEGFHFFPFEKVDEEEVTHLVTHAFPYIPSTWRRIRNSGRMQAAFRKWLLDTIPQQVEDIDAVLSAWRPDVLICDQVFWSPMLVFGETRRIPVAVLSVAAGCVLPGRDAPLWGEGLPRPRNWRMRLRSQMARKLFYWLSARFRAHVNAIRQQYDLPPLNCTVTEFAGQMPLYLMPSAREYDYERRDLPPSVHYVGPCQWDKPANTKPAEWLARLPGDRPLIYVTEATVGTAEPFLLKAAASALRDLPVNVVMTTGKQRSPDELGLNVSAPNIRVENYVPQSDLLPKTAVMITLGGSGGVLAALTAGVPLVVVPTEWDRPENAQRVVEAGAGIRVAPNRCTPERLRAAVARVLHEPTFRANAQRLARAIAGYGGAAYAARLLEDLSSASSTTGELRKGASFVSG